MLLNTRDTLVVCLDSIQQLSRSDGEMGWLSVVVLCSLVNCVRPDVEPGLSVAEATKIESNAELLKVSLDGLADPLGKLNTSYRTSSIRKAAGRVSELTKNVKEVGHQLAASLKRAATDRSTADGDGLGSLRSSVADLRQFLLDTFPKQAGKLGDGKTSVNQLRQASGSDGSADETSDTLLQLRDEVDVLAKAVDASVQVIQTSNAQMESFGFARANEDPPVDMKAWFVLTMYDFEVANVVARYQTSITALHTSLRTAIQTLDVFSLNQKLQPLKEAQSEAYTRIYYDLLNRNQSDIETIQTVYEEIRTNLTNTIESLPKDYSPDTQAAEDALAAMFLSDNANAAVCGATFAPTIATSIVPLQAELLNCLNRERTRLFRVGDGVDRVLQLLQTNNADLMLDIASCTRFPLFDVSDVDLQRAKGCLETNLVEMNEYRRVFGAELDQLEPIVRMEAEASLFRAEVCMKQSANVAAGFMRGTRDALNSCGSSGP